MNGSHGTSETPAPSWVVVLTRALVYAAAAGLFAWPLAVEGGVWGAALGASGGAFVGYGLARSRLRLPVGALAVAVLGTLAVWLAGAVLDTEIAASLFGPELLLHVSGAARWGLGCCAAGATVGFASLRVRALSVVEVAAVFGASSLLVAEHRYGAIHRPFDLADPILVRGGDPTLLFLGVGAGAALLMAGVLLYERKLSRLLVHLLVLCLFAGALFGLTQQGGALPHPQASANGLGLRGKPKDGKGEGGQSSGRPRPDELEFRNRQNPEQMQTPVAVVLFHDDYSPPTGVYYFRQGAFSQFNGRRLVGATAQQVDRDLVQGFSPNRQQVVEVPDAGADRTTLETTIALLADHTRPFALESPAMIEPADNPNPDRFRRVYRATSVVLTTEYAGLLGYPSGKPGWNRAQLAHYTELPDDPRYSKLADEIVQSLPNELRGDAMLKAWSVRDWLSKEGTYSLRPDHAAGDDPTAEFLFGDKIGYCVHFAHAATYLMRALGVPARVATGYAVEESGRQGGSALLITSGNAHAWPEIYLAGVGWVVVDVQPERSLDPPVQPPDADLQRLLGQLARGARVLPADGSPPPATFAALWRWLKVRLLWTAICLLVGLLVVMYAIKLWRALSPRWAATSGLPRVVYRAGLDRLSETGVSRRRGETREAFARRVGENLPSFSALTQAHLSAAFGSRRPLEPDKLRTQARSLRHELGSTIPWYRRFVGWLIPWSWWTSR